MTSRAKKYNRGMIAFTDVNISLILLHLEGETNN